MKAVFFKEFGAADVIEIRDVPKPAPAKDQILVRVRAAGVNRADIVQRKGFYPAPDGFSSQIPGLEFAGEIVEIGENAKNFAVGDRVFGITAGEAQAEFLAVDETAAAKIPENLSFAQAAAVPEAFATAFDAVFLQCGIRAGETLLVHAAASGVGLAALQLANAFDIKAIGTTRSAEKSEYCERHTKATIITVGADAKFADTVQELCGGANVILDLVGASYFAENLDAAALRGRIIHVGLVGGRTAEIDLGKVLQKRLALKGTVLRARPKHEKAALMREFSRQILPMFETGILTADLETKLPFTAAAEAHRIIENNENIGKVVLEFI